MRMTKLVDGLRMSGSRATEKIAWNKKTDAGVFAGRVAARFMSKEQFVERHASGTLRKNMRLGMDGRGQYLAERTAFEFGWGFESIDSTRVMWGDAITFADEQAVTEAGWFIDQYVVMRLFPGDQVEVKQIQVTYPDGKRREGLGIVVRATSAPFVPQSHMVFAIIAEVDVLRDEFKPATNPC